MSLSRQPLVKGERLVRYEVNAVMSILSECIFHIPGRMTKPVVCGSMWSSLHRPACMRPHAAHAQPVAENDMLIGIIPAEAPARMLDRNSYDSTCCWEPGAPPKSMISHIDASLSRQPLVKGERLVRYEVNAVMPGMHCKFLKPVL